MLYYGIRCTIKSHQAEDIERRATSVPLQRPRPHRVDASQKIKKNGEGSGAAGELFSLEGGKRSGESSGGPAIKTSKFP